MSEPSGRHILLAAGLLGACSMLAQLALLREMLVAFSGNELVLGILLGGWFLLTGLGAVPGRFASPRAFLAPGLLALAPLPLLQVLALRAGRDVFLIRGVQAGLGETFLGSLLLLAPYGLLSGFLLALACAALDGAGAAGRVYRADALGCVLGALACTLLLAAGGSHFQLLYGHAFLGLAAGARVARRRAERLLVLALAAGAAALALGTDLDLATSRIQVAGQRLLHHEDSPYGRLMVTEMAGQRSLLLDLEPLASTEDVLGAEEAVHLALAQRPGARRVLLLPGGNPAACREALKHPLGQVAWVELDPRILVLVRTFFPGALEDARLRPVAEDGRRFIRKVQEPFDAAVLLGPDPATRQLNRFYTLEWCRDVKAALAPGGVLLLGAGVYENHLGPELAQMVAGVHRTLGAVFTQVRMVPGTRVLFLASDGPLDLDIVPRLQRAGIATRYLGPDWQREVLRPDRLADLQRALTLDVPLNRDDRPVLCYLHQRYWLSQAPPRRLGAAALAGALALGAWLLRARGASLALFAAGFAVSSLEVVLLLVFQSHFGSVYRGLALLMALFMAGMALGASLGRVRPPRAARGRLAAASLLLAAFAALLAALGGGPGSRPALALMILATGALGGFAFACGAHLEVDGRKAGRLFTADYLGACLGALGVSAFLLPLAGTAWVCGVSAGLCLLGAAAALFRL